MTFLVRWTAFAHGELNRITADIAAPEVVGKALDYIDYNLRRMPRDLGESREPGFRVWYTDLIGVRYRIDEARNTVDIVAVAPARRR